MNHLSVVDYDKHQFKEKILLPKKSKIVTVSFEIVDKSNYKEIPNIEIYVKKQGHYVKLNKIKEIDLDYEVDDEIEFYLEGLSKKLYEVEVFLIIKSFSISQARLSS